MKFVYHQGITWDTHCSCTLSNTISNNVLNTVMEFYSMIIFTKLASVKHGYRSNSSWILPLGFFCRKVTLWSLVALNNSLICWMFLNSGFFFHSVFCYVRCLAISSSVAAIALLDLFTRCNAVKQGFLGGILVGSFGLALSFQLVSDMCHLLRQALVESGLKN